MLRLSHPQHRKNYTCNDGYQQYLSQMWEIFLLVLTVLWIVHSSEDLFFLSFFEVGMSCFELGFFWFLH